MSDVADLNEQEKIFLAGAIKVLILSEGGAAPRTFDDLDRIVEGLGFDDFEEHLERFEKAVVTDEDFEFLARNIFHGEAKVLITRVLWDLALQKGFATTDDEDLIRKIRAWWKE